MSEENINEEATVAEKNIPVFIETDGHTIQVGWASEVNENGGRVIEKFSAFKKVVLVNPIFGDGEGEIQAPIETHVDPEEDGLIDEQGQDHLEGFSPSASFEDEEAEFERQLAEEQARENSKPVEGGTDESLNAAPVSADPDGDKPNPFTRTN